MNPYEELEIKPGATQDQIKQAYHRLAKAWYPDICKDPGANNKMVRLNLAYEMLTKPENHRPAPRRQRPVYTYEEVVLEVKVTSSSRRSTANLWFEFL